MKYLVLTILLFGCGVSANTICGIPYIPTDQGIIVDQASVVIFGPQLSIFKSLPNNQLLLIAGYFTTPFTVPYSCTFVMLKGVPNEAPMPLE